jgi:rubrerythrin
VTTPDTTTADKNTHHQSNTLTGTKRSTPKNTTDTNTPTSNRVNAVPNKQTYRCQQCGNTVTVYVRITEAPVCENKHQPKQMEKTK